MPDDTQDVREMQEVTEDLLVKLYDPDQGMTAKEFDADIAYFERKLARYKERYPEEAHETEEFKRMTMKVEAQLQLLKDTRAAFFKNRSKSGD